jgi:nickel/cobalt exporter
MSRRRGAPTRRARRGAGWRSRVATILYNLDVLLLLLSALALGFLHGLGGDHLMAIAALSVDGTGLPAAVRRARALAVATRFAAGHALLLGVGAGLIVLVGWSIPPHVERGGEMLGGALLIVMGLVTLQHLRGHVHPEHRQHALAASHQHHPRHHSHLAAMMGAAFAVSSLRAVVMLTPFGHDVSGEPLALLLGLIGVFAAGILLSMSLFGVALAGVLSTRALQRVGHGAGVLVGLSSIVLGIAWVATA